MTEATPRNRGGPLVSSSLPICDCASNVDEAIASAIRQTDSDQEALVADGSRCARGFQSFYDSLRLMYEEEGLPAEL